MQLSIVLISLGVAVVTHVTVAKDRELRSTSTWPSGTYGLPMAKSGCPKRYFNEGTRYHDTEDDNSSNEWSNRYTYHLAGTVGKNNMEQKFCMKTHTTANYVPWPRGKYCIFKNKGNNCPHGFTEGYIYWDDEDDDNQNSDSGWLPDGVYDRNTKIYYCCRNDGDVTNPIELPTDDPFVLFKAQNYPCQRVKGMHQTDEWFYWDNEDENGHASDCRGNHPHLVLSTNNIKLYYCYYYK